MQQKPKKWFITSLQDLDSLPTSCLHANGWNPFNIRIISISSIGTMIWLLQCSKRSKRLSLEIICNAHIQGNVIPRLRQAQQQLLLAWLTEQFLLGFPGKEHFHGLCSRLGDINDIRGQWRALLDTPHSTTARLQRDLIFLRRNSVQNSTKVEILKEAVSERHWVGASFTHTQCGKHSDHH